MFVCRFGLTPPGSSCAIMLYLSSKPAHLYYPPAVAWLQAPVLASGQCQTCCVKSKIDTFHTFCTDLMATGPAALHEPIATERSSWAEQKPGPEESGSAQPRRTVLCMLSMDPQCTHILYSVKNGYKRDLLIMFFCSFLSRMDVKNTMVRRSLQAPDNKSHVIDTNLSVTLKKKKKKRRVLLLPLSYFVACWLTLTFI